LAAFYDTARFVPEGVALSRLKQGFDSPRERQSFQGVARKYTPPLYRFFNFSPTVVVALPSEGKGHTFESCRVRHFGTELGTPKLAVFALSAATSVRRSTLFDPMMRSSF
jgi:hypothetical protein